MEGSGADTGPCLQHTDAAGRHAVSAAMAVQPSMSRRGLGVFFNMFLLLYYNVKKKEKTDKVGSEN